MASEYVKLSYVSIIQYDVYNILKTVGNIFKLGSLGRNDQNASAITDISQSGTPPLPIGHRSKSFLAIFG